ncbi:unnamed protein product [Mycena citricolor]|uniref:Uncharacterized protein n=1 Tax=Mycena citricolor TaxID=2018698 RepID=A0AAD2K4L5_9AGAR|nr:unnamed protein product [Mycena citricolor]CAK5278659.1 unnamed protein product [Mycena citricolor]
MTNRRTIAKLHERDGVHGTQPLGSIHACTTQMALVNLTRSFLGGLQPRSCTCLNAIITLR